MSGILANVSLVSGFTILSRILGLFRDMMFFACFGGSMVGSAFVLAFTLPNLFRRMLGEGTLTSAFIPIFSETIQKNSISEGLSLLNKVLSRLTLGLFVILACGIGLSFFSETIAWPDSTKWRLGIDLCSLTLPYVLAICLSALIVGALNVRRKFVPGAASPIILNLVMIVTLAVAGFGFDFEEKKLALALCVSVLVGGTLQLLYPVFSLRGLDGWMPRFDMGSSEGLSRVRGLFVVGAFGAAVGQLNVLVSRFLGYSLDDDGAVSMLFLTARLTELPLGAFAIAISTVVFPEMAKFCGRDDESGFRNAFAKGLRLTLAVTIPAAAGLALLANPILVTLFQWGRFGSAEVVETAPVLILGTLGLPFYAVAAFYVRAFHACKDMKIPLRAAALSLLVNLFFSLALMGPWGVLGLAAANGLAAVLQTCYLIFCWRRARSSAGIHEESSLFLFPVIASTIFMTIVVKFGHSGVDRLTNLSTKGSAAVALIVIIPLAVVVYFVCLRIFSFPEVKETFTSLLQHMRGRERK